ncbi:hypothetical protein ACWFRT_15735 [Streptomyces anulatus]
MSLRSFGKLVTVPRREGADAVGKGRPCGLSPEDRTLLVAAYWLTNLTMRTPATSPWRAAPPPGNCDGCKAGEESGAKAAVGTAITIADGGCPGAGVEHAFARMKTRKILRDCRLKSDGGAPR